MSAAPHISVLAEEVLHSLAPRSGGVYVDGTLGAAGHSQAILEASAPEGRLIGIDRDLSAHELARTKLEVYGDRVTLVHGTFGDIDQHLGELGIKKVDGILLDLGVSSMQLDQGERGFSFMKEGPIDMRMDPSRGESALDLLRRIELPELARILRDYGEERYAKRIAERLKQDVRDDKYETTLDLADAVSACIPAKLKNKMRIHPATRTFQALRIAVNGELDQVERFLEVFPSLLAVGGRCAIISFHSLEDRLVKRCFRELAQTSSLPPEYARKAGERVDPICTRVTRKPIVASEEEMQVNPRSRSAKLRVCEKAPE